MGGWSGGVYSRFRNWVTDKASSINPQAALFDQEDDGFAAGLNNCVTKDGLSKPSSAMDWNGQNLTGVNLLSAANLNVTGATVPANGCYLSAANTLAFSTATTLRGSINATGNWTIAAPTSGTALSITGLSNADTFLAQSGSTSGQAFGLRIQAGSTTADYSLLIKDKSNTTAYLQVRGDGLTQVTDLAGTLQDVGYKRMPLNTVSAAYTLVLTDDGKSVVQTAVNQITIPANSVVAFSPGATIALVNRSGSPITIALNTDTLILAGTGTTGGRTLAANGLAMIHKTDSATWIISGSGLS